MDNSVLTPSLEAPWLTCLPPILTHIDPAPFASLPCRTPTGSIWNPGLKVPLIPR